MKYKWHLAALLALGVCLTPIWWGVKSNAKTPPMMTSETRPVAVARVVRDNLAQNLACDAELRPYQEVELHAKVAGYLDKIFVDIGDRVAAGDLLAVIEIPELKNDIRRAEAVLKRSEKDVARYEAARREAQLAFKRLDSVEKSRPNLVARQDLDEAQTKADGAAAAFDAAKEQVEVARAELDKLKTMLDYSRITAPFSGVITKRYADPGALIQTGISSDTQTLPLVRLSQTDKLRLAMPVSVPYVSRIKVGAPVEIRVVGRPQALNGTVARSASKVEMDTRTMEVEVDVPNADLSLIPGMYATAIWRMSYHEHALAVPVQAVSRQKVCSVLVVDKDNILRERVFTPGLETPDKIEVLEGLHENDLVMIGNRSQATPGQRVEPKLMPDVAVK